MDLRKRPGKRKMDMNLATWNVRSLYRTGALRNLIQELNKYNISIAAIQEIRWRGSEIFDSENYTVLYSGSGNRNNFGTGFLIHKKFKSNLLNFDPINERMCSIRLKGRFFNTTIVSVHAPTEDKDETSKNNFYDQLDRVCQQIPKYDVVIIMGDLNAKIGKDYKAANIGKHTLHDITNDNGERLCDFAITRDFVVSSTMFPHKNIHLQTWTSPDGNTTNQIDHVLVSKRHASDILDVRSLRGADCDSDHFLIRVKYRQRMCLLTSHPNKRCIKFDIGRLKDKVIADDYRRSIENKMGEQTMEDMDIEQKWVFIKQTICNTATEVLSTVQKQNRNQWFDKECQEAIKSRNAYRLKMMQKRTRAAEEEYKTARRATKNICKKKKKELEESILYELDENFGRNESRKFFESVRNIKTGFQPRTTMCKNKEGTLVAGEQEILKLWVEHFNDLLNEAREDKPTSNLIYFGPDPLVPPPTIFMVNDVIRRMKNNRAPGEDSINMELIKHGGRALWKHIYNLILDIWQLEQMPNDWNVAIICPIHKKGSKLECNNYRGISLLNVTYKIFTNILSKYIEPYAESALGDYQCGFRKGRSTTDQVFSLRMILEKFYEFNLPLHQLYIDFKQAFDTINRNYIFDAMAEFGIPRKLIALTKMTLMNTQNKVKIQNKLSEKFITHNGIRQGDSLSTLLFNIGLERVIRKIAINPGGTIFNRMFQYFAFADDVAVFARNVSSLDDVLKQIHNETNASNLNINRTKTKYMNNITTRDNTVKTVVLNEVTFEKVSRFRYLGSIVTEDNNILTEIKDKIAIGNRSLRALDKIIRTRYISKKMKVRIYKTIIKPTVTFGSETWTLPERAITILNTWERKILRKIYGPIYDKGEWRIRTNSELQKLYKDSSIVTDIKIRRLEWLGHIIRMDNNNIPKRLLDATLSGKRRAGRPKLRWLDDVQDDLVKAGIKRWRRRALEREDWAAILKEVKAKLKGLYDHR